MEDVLYVRINNKSYVIYSSNNVTWRLFYLIDRMRLNIHTAHTLDYWCGKGMIQDEEEKKNKGS